MNLDSMNINYIVYFQLNIQLQVNSHQNVAICYIGKNQNGSYPGSCSRQVPNMFKLTKIWSPITNGMPSYTYEPSLRLLAQYLDIWPPLSTRAGLVWSVLFSSSIVIIMLFQKICLHIVSKGFLSACFWSSLGEVLCMIMRVF